MTLVLSRPLLLNGNKINNMNAIRLFCIIFFTSYIAGFACQQVPLQTEIIFTTHKVKKKETLYSISKQYQVSVEELKRYNEELYQRSLRKGEKIRIPVYKNAVQKDVTTGIHIVKPRETRWGIAHAYGLTVAQLQELNPTMGETVRVGDTLYIAPKEPQEIPRVSEAYVLYEVKPKETLYSLAKFFDISPSVLQEWNPELKDGLKAGMVLKLPKTTTGKDTPIAEASSTEKQTLLPYINKNHRSKIVLLLPLKLNNVPIDSVELVKKRFKTDKTFQYALDFYSGALVALDSAKQLGLSVTVKVIDTEASSAKMETLLEDTDITSAQAVIGPFYSAPFNSLSEGLKKFDVPILSPLNEKNIEVNENVFQTIPSEEYMRETMIAYIARHSQDKKILLIGDEKNAEVIKQLKAKLPDAEIITPKKDKSITLQQLQTALSPKNENWVVLETGDDSSAANITSLLNSLNNRAFSITLLTTYKTDAFSSEAISNAQLSNLSFQYPTIDKPSSLDNTFFKKYEAAYFTTPNRYAVRGFDIMMDVLLRLASAKNLYKSARDHGETEYVENKFRYEKKLFGGYYNKALYIVKYDNLEVKEIPQ